MEIGAPRYQAWRVGRDVRDRRRHLVQASLHVLSLHALLVVVSLQVRRLFGDASAPVSIGIVLATASVLAFDVMLLGPGRSALLDALERTMRAVLLALARSVSFPLLVMVYLCTWPANVMVFRRRYVRERPAHASWFGAAAWRIPTWVAKTSESLPHGQGSGFRLLRLLARVRTGGGYYLVLLALFVLLALSLNVVTTSPKVAPFIYTLF